MSEFWSFALVGFLAQLVDGTLGMGFGIISSSVLLAQGIPPALASASVNAAKLPTTATAAISHFIHKNHTPRLLIALCVFGSLGGFAGAMLLTSLKGKLLFHLINAYLLGIGGLIIYRGFAEIKAHKLPKFFAQFVGFGGGLVEGIGGSWGPIVTTGLLGAGVESRYAVGATNISEFAVSLAVFLSFVFAFYIGHWQGGADWHSVFSPVLGLVVGGLPAALAGGYLSKIAPRRELTIVVGMLAMAIGTFRIVVG
jgi:uncharacterized membrane protein YfcA